MTPFASRMSAWYTTVAAFNVETLFVKKRAPGPSRTVYINEDIPEDYVDKKGKVKPQYIYANNQVITSKYSIITFLPRNLLEQFRRIANVFFLGIAILQFFSKFSTISPGIVILPLLIVLGITAVKDGYEDIKRHQSDRKVNHTHVRIANGGGCKNSNVTHPKTSHLIRPETSNFLLKFIPMRRKKSQLSTDAEKTEVLGSNPGITHFPSDIEFDDERTPEEHHFWKNSDHLKPHWKRSIWEDVRVGDFIKIHDNEPIPADILICATSEEDNVSFVETKNLDGETNLKSRMAVPDLTHLRTAAECVSKRNVFRVDCDRPDTNMYKLNAAIRVGDKQMPVDIQTTLLRGTVLRNTKWVIGVVLFTGEDTKIVMNSGGTPSKRSKVERQMNPQVFINLIILALMAITCAIVDSVLEHQDYPRGALWLFDDNGSDDNPSINGLVTWAFALITFQNIVPISLYISIEFVRTCQAAFIYFDYTIWYDKTNQSTLARSWNLSDDLGQIEYIFSDKTGTLTQNCMIFQQCSVGGKVYSDDPAHIVAPKTTSGNFSEPTSDNRISSTTTDEPKAQSPSPEINHFYSVALTQDLSDALHSDPSSCNAAHARSLNGFFSVLSLCHTVLTSVDPATGKIEYKAQSPDEAALVQAAADVGYVFKGKDRDILTLEKPGIDEPVVEKYELLNILEFNSARKRMSVVLRSDSGKIFLLTKGADSVIFELLKPGVDETLRGVTETHLSEFANNGLRTLTLAYKMVNEEEYASWNERYHDATVSIEDREAKVDAASAELEHDLRLLGATAIEDSLQDGVPETISDLKRAGIKIWVATGDKLETAIAIGHSTNLISPDSNIIVIRGGSRPVYQQMINAAEEFFPESHLLDDGWAQTAEEKFVSNLEPDLRPNLRRAPTGVSSIVGANNGDRPGGFILVIDGAALNESLHDEHYKKLLLEMAILCEGVICCRVSPLQKALIVKLVKDGLGAMTLAIGDGANDVSMIQAADVGVGIAGEEGLQAVNSSDYAIAQFRFLKRLLLVHGHWSYARNGNMIVNFFYKNIVCIGVLWWFQIYDGWSSTYVFEYTYLLWWNSFFTIAPVIAIGLFDRLADAEVLMALPELYRAGREGTWFGLKSFSIYMLDGIYQSAIIYFLILFAYDSTTSRTDGYDVYLYEFSTTMVVSAVIVANLFNGLNTNVWTGWVFFAIFIGIVIVWAYTAIYSLISPGWFAVPVFGNDHFLFRSATFWLSLPLTVCLSLLPRYISKAYKFVVAPDDIDIIRWLRKVEPDRDLAEEAYSNGPNARLTTLRRSPTFASDAVSERSVSVASMAPTTASNRRRPPSGHQMDVRSASRTDMSTGHRSIHRGFDFATEEGGVAMRHMQSNLSVKRMSMQGKNVAPEDVSKHRRKKSELLRSILKRKPRTPTSP